MGRKGGKSPKNKKDGKTPKKSRTREDSFASDPDMDDEIDAFHKQRDVIPLDVDGDLSDASDEDTEQPVFEFEDNDDDDNEDDDDDEDEDDDEDNFYDDKQLKGLAAKIVRQQKFLRQKIGGVEDEMHDDVEEEEKRKAMWGRKKHLYYSAENIDYELQSSDEELPAEEEAEVLRLQREKAQSLRMEDFGLEDADEEEIDSDGEKKTLQSFWGEKRLSHKDDVGKVDTGTTYEEVKKDLNALTKEEQMDVVYSSAPELVGLLSELNGALNELEDKVKPLLCKMKEQKDTSEGGMQYLEVKKLLLLTYCQAISFYLLLKAEGHPVRDHPVIAHLVAIKNLLDKVKQIDGNLPSHIEEILNHKHERESEAKPPKALTSLKCEPYLTNHSLSLSKTCETATEGEIPDLVKVALSMDLDSKDMKNNQQEDQVGLQSLEMMKLREHLEEKLKQKGLYGSSVSKANGTQKRPSQPLNRRLETLDGFDDEIMDKEAAGKSSTNGHASSLHSAKLSQLVVKANRPKFVSGDDDLPLRDDIGERRRKYELKVLAKAGAAVMYDLGDEENDNADSMDEEDKEDEELQESEDEFYREAKRQRAAKISVKEALYSRTPVVPSLPEAEVDGKRQISYQMEKNRGLTRARKKLTKIPRKKYKLKHQKAVVRRKGQVRDIRKPSGPYGGEVSGINTRISRSVRFKS